MKINEKHLLSFAGSHASADKKGVLHKRGEVNKAFQKRWFVLKGNMLFYYERKEDRDPIGVIILEGCTVELSEMNDTNTFTFELVFQGSGSRTYILAADTQEDMESWMKAITCANYDYMKLMVAELQRQLDDINAESIENRSDLAAGRTSQNLVDLSVPDHSSTAQSQSSQRRNPFGFVNPVDASASGLDAFGATPFQPAVPNVSNSSCSARTFEQIHNDFGKYIKEKMESYGRAKSPLVDIFGASTT